MYEEKKQKLIKNIPENEYQKLYRKDYKQKRISITITKEEYSELKKLAQKQNIGLATLVKSLTFSNKEQKNLLTDEQLKLLENLYYEVNKIGININQIATAFNKIVLFDNGNISQDTLKKYAISLKNEITELQNIVIKNLDNPTKEVTRDDNKGT